MDTTELRYRIVDFLKTHAPFNAVDDADLLALVAGGRVRFHEPNDYILWQGEPHKAFVFVIQQGTVSLWDDTGAKTELRDVRGAGDMLGIERYNDARSCLYSARSESDTVLYGFRADDFEAHVLNHPHAAQYVMAEARVTTDYRASGGRRDPQRIFLHDVVGHRPVATCDAHATIATVARDLLAGRADAIMVVDEHQRARGAVTTSALLAWVASGAGDAHAPVARVLPNSPLCLRPTATVADGVLAMGAADATGVLITSDGTADGTVQAFVSARDLATVFGDQPTVVLGDIRRAATLPELGALNHRARVLMLDALAGAASVDWLAPFARLVNDAIVTRLLAIEGIDHAFGCWCCCGAAGRAEALTLEPPHLVVVLEDDTQRALALDQYRRVVDALQACGYVPRLDMPFEDGFYVAATDEWARRYRAWMTDPIMQETYRSRTLFDLRPVHGSQALWRNLEALVSGAVNQEFLHILANDCLDNLPPLTFFHDSVVDSVGDHSAIFKLEQTALRPLVDVGRVFGMAARSVMGHTTLERFATARTLLPEHEAVFRDAADTLRVVLWQQARVGISHGTTGYELPPDAMSRYDRQILKGGFRSILRLIEFTAARKWIGRV